MKLRTIGMTVVAALALVAGRAQAQDAAAPAPAPAAAPAAGEDAGWNTRAGVLFTLPNLFQNGSGQIIDGYDRKPTGVKVGFQYNLGAQAALRLSANLSRTSAGIIENTDTAGVVTKTVPNPTSTYGVKLAGEYLIRMTPAAISPYLGFGAYLSYDAANRKGTAEAPGTTTEYDNKERTFGFGLLGKLGLEWRVHRVIALFAEYQADLNVVSASSNKFFTKSNGTVVTDTESKQKEFLQLSTGIAQGGQLGVIAFF